MTEEEFLALTGQSAPKKKKSPKYRNVKVYVCKNGAVFRDKDIAKEYGIVEIYDSIKEYDRWVELNLLQRAGEISGLTRQSKWVIQEKTTYKDEVIREIAYKADFEYYENGLHIVEDVKPFDKIKEKYITTKDFKLKWKLLKEKYPDIEFRIY